MEKCYESHSEVVNRKDRSAVRCLPSEVDALFNFQPCVQSRDGSISVWEPMTVKRVGSLVFYDG